MKLFAASSTLVATALSLLPLTAANPIEANVYRRQDSSSSGTQTSSSSSSTSSASSSFATDVGYLGSGSYGTVPFLVETDRLNGSRGASPYEDRFNATDADKSDFDLFKSLGNISPYHASSLFPSTTAHSKLNDTCSVKQVHIFHRHGARYPTSSTTEGAPLFGATATNWTKAGNLTATGPLAFLQNYTFALGAEYLVPIGSQQLFDSGVFHFMQYGRLFNRTLSHKPVVRTPSESRMLDSARYFLLGAFGYDAFEKVNLEVIIEEDGFNSTLSPYYDCPQSDAIYVGDDFLRPEWDATYLAAAVKRLQPYTNLNLTIELVYGMQNLCPYESAALGYSPFCGLFTEDEWKGLNYDLSLQFAGDYGWSAPTGRAQGIGYVQQLLARLTNSTLDTAEEPTTRNTTLDNSTDSFPLDQAFYLDFTHDDVIVSVLTALNFTQFATNFSTTEITPSNMTLSEVTPFAARLVFEIIECNGTEYIRTLINEAVIPMDQGQGCKHPRKDGLCRLEDFVDYQQENALKDSNFEYACFGNYTLDGATVLNGTVYGSL